jgi:hypothetical protein
MSVEKNDLVGSDRGAVQAPCRHSVMNIITVALGFLNVMNSLQQKTKNLGL